MFKAYGFLLLLVVTAAFPNEALQAQLNTSVLVVGGGTGGTAAAIASAREGAATLLVEEGPWLGGMIAAAGVSCADGNHNLPSGLWNEFRNHIYKHYGGPGKVATGWVSNTNFEPHVSDSIWKLMAGQEKNLRVLHGWRFSKALMKGKKVIGAVFTNVQNQSLTVKAAVTIDATELGDLFASAGAPYSLGMEAGSTTEETVGITSDNSIIQDLTYVAILKNYGAGADCTIAKPVGYTPDEFDGACTDYYHNKQLKAPNVDAKKMLDYGKLPNQKYMINWPNQGNDTYLNIVEMTPEQRTGALEKAKQTTLRFIYFIQHQLGMKHLGLADDEFPTADRLALMPYHREGRRVEGVVRFTMRHIAEPFTYGNPLYRTGIAVGDYPIDHHHKKNPDAPQHLDFYPVPSFNVPLGALIPKNHQGLLAAEKGISVSNVANGTTRLQPVVILTGQAAGTLAALAAIQQKTPAAVDIRTVQQHLLKKGAYLMPYMDVKPADPHFEAIQKTGATGILRGKGIPYQWANQTWFYPDSMVSRPVLIAAWNDFFGKKIPESGHSSTVTLKEAISLAYEEAVKTAGAPFHRFSTLTSFTGQVAASWNQWKLAGFNAEKPVTRREMAVLLHHTVNPFGTKKVDHSGFLKNQK